MKKTIIWCLIFVLCLLFVLPSDSYASGQAVKDYFTNSSSTSHNSNSGSLDKSIDTVSSAIYIMLRTFAIILAVCILTTIAISYMVATPGKRAKLKEQLVYYFAGVIFLLAGTAFLSWYEGAAHRVADSFTGDSTYVAGNSNWINTHNPTNLNDKTDYSGYQSSFGNAMSNALKETWEFITGMVQGATNAVNAAKDWCVNAWEDVKDWAGDAWEWATGWL